LEDFRFELLIGSLSSTDLLEGVLVVSDPLPGVDPVTGTSNPIDMNDGEYYGTGVIRVLTVCHRSAVLLLCGENRFD
jgi:hypothetical protein